MPSRQVRAAGAFAYVLNMMAGPASGVGIQVQYLFYRFRLAGGRCSKYSFYCSRNVLESEGTVEKGRNRHFVGGIQRNRLGSPFFDCLVS